MTIEVFSMWYNEEYLAPLFLKHYSWADKITIFYDKDTTDKTMEFLKKTSRINIIPFQFSNGMDEIERTNFQNEYYKKIECDYVLYVDADEFVFLKTGSNYIYDIKSWVNERKQYDIFVASIFQVYRHHTDLNLDRTAYPVPQRIHGDPNITEGINKLYNKPLLAKKNLPVEWGFGNHALKSISESYTVNYCPDKLLGAHWANADPEFVFERRIKNRSLRFSERNIKKRYDKQNFDLTDDKIRKELDSHLNDPVVL